MFDVTSLTNTELAQAMLDLSVIEHHSTHMMRAVQQEIIRRTNTGALNVEVD